MPMPRLKEVVRGSVQMLCVGRYSASEPQNLEAKVDPCYGHCPARPQESPQLGQNGASWLRVLTATVAQELCAATPQPS